MTAHCETCTNKTDTRINYDDDDALSVGYKLCYFKENYDAEDKIIISYLNAGIFKSCVKHVNYSASEKIGMLMSKIFLPKVLDN